ncbi:MAG: LysR substrate-binding domain-containing protein [Pseudomonadota bacterium]
MMNFTLKQLRYFEALAKHCHFGRAAAACSISQPALSVQIKELEQEIGSALFERSARHVRLTIFGEEFATRVREILRSVDEVGDLARAAKDQLVGRLRMGVIPTVAPYLLPTIIGNIARSHAGVDLHIRESMTQALVRELRDGRLDAALVALPVSEPSFSQVALFEESFVLVRPKTDEGKPVPSADALRNMRLLLLEEGHCFRDQALSYCNIQTTVPRDGLDGTSLATLVQLVSAGIGVTLIPDMAVGIETRSAPVAISRFRNPLPGRRIGMIWRSSSPLAKDLLQIADVVRQSADEVKSRTASNAEQKPPCHETDEKLGRAAPL